MAINFDLNDLLAFRAVAELSNFRKAKAMAPDNAVVANNLQMLAKASAA